MLDFFLIKGFVKLNEDGTIEKTELCPKDIVIKEDEDGIAKFYYFYPSKISPQYIPIMETEEYNKEYLN